MKKDLTGKKFGKLTVQSVHSRTRNGHIRWSCLCDCGNECDVLSTHLISNKTKSCGCSQATRGKEHSSWNGYGEISGNVWNSVVRGANGAKGRKIIDFDIDIRYAWNLFLEQNRKCALTGLEIYFPHSDKGLGIKTASLDRICSSKGYIKGNVQWVHKDINLMKNRLDEDRFKYLCELVSKNGDI